MTLDEFDGAKHADDQYTVTVNDHKTAHKYGSAKVILDIYLYCLLLIYRINIRPLLETSEENTAFFMNSRGKQLHYIVV